MAKAKKSFFHDIIKEMGDDDASVVVDGVGSAEFTGCIDTGSYALNALLSGSIHGGIPNNKVIAFAGESSTGKTYFTLGIVKRFLDAHPEAGVIYYDTEAAVTRGMMESHGIDVSRVVVSEPVTIQQFRTKAVNFLEAYEKHDRKERPPFMMVLDSLGALSTEKEVKDIGEGSDTRDMTRSQLIRGAFRVLRLRLAKAMVPMVVTNHVYSGIGPYAPARVMSGGGGLRYASDDIIFLSKKSERVGTENVGALMRCQTYKSRMSRENQEVTVRVSHSRGLDRYYGLREIADKAGILKKDGNRFVLPDGRKVYGKEIDETPAAVFDPILAQVEDAAGRQFRYNVEPGDSVVDGSLVTPDGELVETGE